MAILDDRNVSQTSQGTVNGWGVDGSYSQLSSVDKLRREGTGTRRRPRYPDTTPYKRTQETYLAPRGTNTRTRSNGTQQIHKGPLAPLDTEMYKGLLLDTSSRNAVDLAALRAMKAFDRRDMDLGTAWKERGKTAQLVAQTADTAVHALNAIRKRNGRELLDVLGLDHTNARGSGVVDTYLAYQYGLKPSLQDVKGAVQALTRLPPEDWAVRGHGRHSDEFKLVSHRGKNGYASYMLATHYSDLANASIIATPRPLTREQDMLWALGLDNPLSTGWEVTPFSFLVDWMVPVGDWLQALNSFKYYSGWSGCYTSMKKEVATFSGASHTLAGISCQTILSGGKYERVVLDRKVTSGLPLLGLPIKDPRSIDHMAKALALLASRTANGGGLPPVIRY